jgi:hypothetical protein
LIGPGALAVDLSINETIHVTDAPDLTPGVSLMVAENVHVTDTEPGLAPPSLILPTPGLTTILGTSNVNLQWTPDSAVKDSKLLLGIDGLGASDLFNSVDVTGTSVTVSIIPADGVTVHARFYWLIGST